MVVGKKMIKISDITHKRGQCVKETHLGLVMVKHANHASPDTYQVPTRQTVGERKWKKG